MPTPQRATDSQSTQRAVVPALGSVLLVVVTILLAVALTTAVIGESSTPDPSSTVALELSVDGSTLTVTQTAGEPLDIEALSMQVAVDGEPLEYQPPVPFFFADGFVPESTGAFNPSGSTELTVGESASLTVAETNSPAIEAGSTVTVTLYEGQTRLLQLETTARSS